MFESLNKHYQGAIYDSAAGQAAAQIQDDSLDAAALNSEIQNLRRAALITVLLLAEAIVDNQLGEDELPSDRLDALLAGFSANDEDDEGIDVDQATLDIFIATIQDALLTLGVSTDVVETMFEEGEDAEAAIESAAEIIESNTPSGDDLDELVDLFVYGEEPEEPTAESELLDAATVGKTTKKKGKFGTVVYKSVKAIRSGQLKIVNKRIAGKVKLSPEQRQALNKARRKATTATALKKRARSMLKRKNLNL